MPGRISGKVAATAAVDCQLDEALADQPQLLQRFARWLRPSGWLLVKWRTKTRYAVQGRLTSPCS
jgi:hypothetical protein